MARAEAKMMMFEIAVTERLWDRVQLAAAYEGVSVNTYLEKALLDTVVTTERRVSKNEEAYRDAAQYPYPCEYCSRRFKLPMHRERHVTWSHPEMRPEDEKHLNHEPPDGFEIEPDPEPAPEPEPVQDERFKLAPGVAELMDEFDKQFNDDVPRLD